MTLLTALIIGIISANAQISKYKARRLSVIDGLPSNTIRAIVQDNYGFIWVGGTSGLARFDGYRFTDFNGFGKDRNRNTTQHIGKLTLDSSHNLLWTSTNTFIYACMDLNTDKFADMSEVSISSKPYSSRFLSTRGLWIYNKTAGARFISYNEGHIARNDFTEENKLLPSNKINDIAEDSQHNIWLSTDKGMTRITPSGYTRTYLKGSDIICSHTTNGYIAFFDRKQQMAYLLTPNGDIVRKNKLSSAIGFINGSQGEITWNGKWIIFTSKETYAWNLKTGIFEKDVSYQIPQGNIQGDTEGYQFVANKTGNLWVFAPNGTLKKFFLNPNAKFSNDKKGIFKFAHDKQGRIYIASYGAGLYMLDPKTWTTQQFTAEDQDPLIYSNYLLDVIVDKSGCIWVTTEGAGISCISPIGGPTINFYIPDETKKGDWSNYVRLIYRGKDNQIYINTRNNRIYTYQPGRGFDYKGNSKSGIYGYLRDSKGHEWIVTRGDGITIDGKHYSEDENEGCLPSNNYFDIAEDKSGHIWLASWGNGLLRVTYQPGKPLKTEQFMNQEYNKSRIHDLEIGPDGILWIASYDGLYKLNTNKKTITDKDFIPYNMQNGGLPNDEVICVKRAGNGMIWVGVTGSGLIRCDFSKGGKGYTQITREEGLSNNNVRTIAEDKFGYIWASTEEGISRINPNDNTVTRYTASTNIQSNFFSENSCYTMPDGNILFGTGYGIAEIMPADDHKKISYSTPRTPIVTDIQINGLSIYESGEDSTILQKALCSSDKLELKHNQNSLTIYYSNFNYPDIESQLYTYYLEGVDKDWRPVTSENKADYSNLDPGSYTFHIKSFSNNKWSKESTLKITVREPWYNTWWAWLLYLVILGCGAYYVYRNAKRSLQMNQQIQVEKQLSDFRLNFFTNITHEFRTPLAIIQNAVSKLSEPGHTGSQAAIQTAQRGTNRLLRLVNQLMEFRKISTGNERLQIEKGDIIVFVRDIYHDLWSLSKQKEISLNYTPFAKHYEMVFDQQIVETIVYNLISNAVKYTPEHGTINVRLNKDDIADKIIIEVEDNGKGISDSQQKVLFTPFMKGNVSRGGMGIGLYTAHRMAELHHGNLTYQNVSGEGGSLFRVTLPASDEVYLPDDYKKVSAIEHEAKEIKESEAIIREMQPEAFNNQKVAIIEDDPDMMQQVKGEISIYFKTTGYTTGETALQGIREDKPDLILCDVMLPDTDGYAIVKELKKAPDYRNIPVIMLTALDDEAHQIKGYQAGADDYMIKPCNFKLLIARMIQLMQWRRNVEIEVKNIAEDKKLTAAPVAPAIISDAQDKKFKEQVESIIDSHISDTSFSVDVLASLMKMGRTKFYGKMKDLYGISPNKYIMNERMQKAEELIKEGDLTIAEVGYKVGIPDASYFNKCFKQKYGVTPSKYKEMNV